MKNNQAEHQHEPYRDDDNMEIDVVGIIKYLWRHVISITAIALIPLFLFVIFGIFQAKSYNKHYLAAIVKVNHRVSNLNLNAIISESIIASVLEENSMVGNATELVPLFNLVPGYERFNERIEENLIRLSGEVAAGRGENQADIEQRFASLMAGQDMFLTIYFDLEKSPLSNASARILMSEIINRFNDEFGKGRILAEPALSEIDMRIFDNMEGCDAYNLQKLLGIVNSHLSKVNRLAEIKYDRQGFNPDLLRNRLTFIDMQLQRIISDKPELQVYFLIQLDTELAIVTADIQALNQVLEIIAASKGGVNIGELGGVDRSGFSAEFSAELFERFLKLGASVSLVEFQKELLTQKLGLEFRRNKLQERKRMLSTKGRAVNGSDMYASMLEETKNIANEINDHLLSYHNNYYRQLLTPVMLQHQRPARILQPRLMAILLVASFGLTVFYYIARRSFRRHVETAS